MTAEEFERGYARRSGISVEELRRHRTVRPCRCGTAGCEGWQSLSHENAADLDRFERERMEGKYAEPDEPREETD